MNLLPLEKITSAGSTFLIWHFLTLFISGTGVLMGGLLRRGNPHVRSTLLRITLLLALFVPLICVTWNWLPHISLMPKQSIADNSPAIPREGKSSDLPSINWNDVAVWHPVVADLRKFQGQMTANPGSELAPTQIIYAVFLGLSFLISLSLFGRLTASIFSSESLRRRGKAASTSEQARCGVIATAMGVSHPQVLLVNQLESPLVLGLLKSVILLPASMEIGADVYRHELTHVKRRDLWWHLLARLATILLPLQPGFWFLKKALEQADEDVCDDMVLVHGSNRSSYAKLLLNLAESYTPTQGLCLPMAAFGSQLERRLHRVLDTARLPSSRISLSSLGLSLAPLFVVGILLGFIYIDAAAPLHGADATPNQSGTITGRVVSERTGKPLANVLVRAGLGADLDMRFVRGMGTPLYETRTNEQGEYNLTIPLSQEKTPSVIKLDAMTPGYRSSAGVMGTGGDFASVTLIPRGTGSYNFKLKEAIYLKGKIVDEAGIPIVGGHVGGQFKFNDGSSLYVATTKSDQSGQFELFDFPLNKPLLDNVAHNSVGVISVSDKDYCETRTGDIYKLKDTDRTQIRLTLLSGKSLTGNLLDNKGQPAPNVMVEAVPVDVGERKATMTDQNGHFVLKGLATDKNFLVRAHSFTLKEKFKTSVCMNQNYLDQTFKLSPVQISKPPKPIEVLGMKLVDANKEWNDVYDLSPVEAGALILDPGQDSARLNIGTLHEGNLFWLVQDVNYKGTVELKSVKDFVNAILKDIHRNADGSGSCRVVYTFADAEFSGTNTQYIKVTARDIHDLKNLAKQLNL